MSQELQFNLKINTEVLIQAKIFEISQRDMVDFFIVQFKRAIECPPNFRFFGEKKQIWIIRGFYPESKMFFKMVVLEKAPLSPGYYIKVSTLRHYSYAGRSKYDGSIIFTSQDYDEYIRLKMENAILGADHDLTSDYHKIKMPKCVSPKGMELFRYNKPSRRKKHEDAKEQSDEKAIHSGRA